MNRANKQNRQNRENTSTHNNKYCSVYARFTFTFPAFLFFWYSFEVKRNRAQTRVLCMVLRSEKNIEIDSRVQVFKRSAPNTCAVEHFQARAVFVQDTILTYERVLQFGYIWIWLVLMEVICCYNFFCFVVNDKWFLAQSVVGFLTV